MEIFDKFSSSSLAIQLKFEFNFNMNMVFYRESSL